MPHSLRNERQKLIRAAPILPCQNLVQTLTLLMPKEQIPLALQHEEAQDLWHGDASRGGEDDGREDVVCVLVYEGVRGACFADYRGREA